MPAVHAGLRGIPGLGGQLRTGEAGAQALLRYLAGYRGGKKALPRQRKWRSWWAHAGAVLRRRSRCPRPRDLRSAIGWTGRSLRLHGHLSRRDSNCCRRRSAPSCRASVFSCAISFTNSARIMNLIVISSASDGAHAALGDFDLRRLWHAIFVFVLIAGILVRGLRPCGDRRARPQPHSSVTVYRSPVYFVGGAASAAGAIMRW